MALAVLVIFSINTFSSVGNGDGLGITTIQTKKRAHQLPDPLDQQIAILVGLDINSNQVREQSVADNLVYGIVKPDDIVPAGIDEDHSYLVTSNHDREISSLSKAGKKKVTIEYANCGGELHTKTTSLSQLVEQSYWTRKQRQQVSRYTSALWAEQLIGHRKLGL